jgi:hypothetical protein
MLAVFIESIFVHEAGHITGCTVFWMCPRGGFDRTRYMGYRKRERKEKSASRDEADMIDFSQPCDF